MTEKILCVDDDQNVLDAYRRSLRKQFHLETAQSGAAALELIENEGPYAVIVADMSMPGMDGIQLLTRVREIAPDSVRMMLTGNADLQTAMEAVNEGNIFRFLTKPCPPEKLARALYAGIEQYRLITAERELLQKTFSGSIQVLIEILSTTDPQSFGRAQTMREGIQRLAQALGVEVSWQMEVAAMLSQIGRVTIPLVVLLKNRAGQPLSVVEQEMLVRVPEIGSNLLAHIPRLEPVAQIILYQSKHFDGSGFPRDSVAGENIPLEARMLKVLADLAQLEAEGTLTAQAFEIMRIRRGWYDPRVLEAAFFCFVTSKEDSSSTRQAVPVPLRDLRLGDVLASDIRTDDGKLLISAGHQISFTLLERIWNFARLAGIKEPVYVEQPMPEAEKRAS